MQIALIQQQQQQCWQQNITTIIVKTTQNWEFRATGNPVL